MNTTNSKKELNIINSGFKNVAYNPLNLEIVLVKERL